MAEWPESPTLIGTRIPRLDGLLKASGKAKYPSDVRPEGTLFGVMLYSPYAHAKVKSIDISAAEKMPGVKAVHRDRQGRARPSAIMAMTSPPSRPRPRSKPSTPSAPSRSSTRYCPTWPPRRSPWPRGARGLQGGNVRKGRSRVQGKAR